MDKGMRVCHVLHGIVGGGSEQVVLNYCSRMHGIRFDSFYQYEPNPQILERFEEAGFNCIQIPDKVHHPIKHLWTMYRLFKKGGYDVVHSHQDWFLNAYVMFLAWLAGVPKRIAHHHQAYHPTNPLLKFLCAILRVPNRIFATHWLACGKAAAENGWGKKAVVNDKVLILPNAIDPERFKFDVNARKMIREQYGMAEDDFVVGHVGRFFPEKNHRFLINVFKNFNEWSAKSKLLLLGDGPLLIGMKRLAKQLGMEQNVVFAGLQKNPAQFYNAMDVLCLPSVREALGIVLVEAQCSGLPCISSKAVPQEAKISENFFQADISNEKDWISLLTKVFKASVPRHSCVPDEFDIQKTYKILESLYLE